MRTQMIMAAVACLATAGGSHEAIAQSAADRIAAEQLFQDGRALMKSGDFAAACPKLEASFELDPALGTQLNLALCYEHIDRLASAWAHYRRAADRAARAGQQRRADVARTRAAEIEPRVPRLVIHVRDAARIPGLVITRDDAALDPTLLGEPLHVDAGEHHVRATAPGRQPFSLDVHVATGEERVIEVPRLAPVTRPERQRQRPGTRDTEPVARTGERDVERPREPGQGQGAGPQTPPRAPVPPAPDDRPARTIPEDGQEDARNPRRTVAWIAGGTGVTGLAIGLALGWAAGQSAQDLFAADLCNPDTRVCANDEALARLESARTRARVAAVMTASGVAFVAAGAVLFWTSRETGESTRSARVVPMADSSGLGLAVSGRF